MGRARAALPGEHGDEARDEEEPWAKSASEALQGADALAIVTEWQEFRSPDFDSLRRHLKQPLIFDGRNLYDPEIRSQGFDYLAIGR